MDPILLILLIFLILALGGLRYGGDNNVYIGGGLGLVMLILLILYLTGNLHR